MWYLVLNKTIIHPEWDHIGCVEYNYISVNNVCSVIKFKYHVCKMVTLSTILIDVSSNPTLVNTRYDLQIAVLNLSVHCVHFIVSWKSHLWHRNICNAHFVYIGFRFQKVKIGPYCLCVRPSICNLNLHRWCISVAVTTNT